MKTPMMRASLVIIAALTCAAPGCNPIQFEWQGPSPTFRRLDINHDGAIDAFEWEKIWGSSMGAMSSFLRGDCDRDGRLTWSEYFADRFKRRWCRPAHEWQEAIGPDTAYSSPLLALKSDVVGHLDRKPMLLPVGQGDRIAVPDHYSATALAPEQAARMTVTFELGAAELRAMDEIRAKDDVAEYDPLSGRPWGLVSFVRLRCTVRNANSAIRLTLLDLDLEWEIQDSTHRRRYLKTVWIEPQASDVLHAWFAVPVERARCRFNEVRGQKTG